MKKRLMEPHPQKRSNTDLEVSVIRPHCRHSRTTDGVIHHDGLVVVACELGGVHVSFDLHHQYGLGCLLWIALVSN